MNRGLKISLIIGGVIVGGTGGYLAYRSIKKKKDAERDKKRLEEENKKELEESIAELGTTSSGSTSTPSSTGKCQSKFIKPIRNMEMDINNRYSEIKGITLYPAQKSSDPSKGHNYAKGYTTLRNSAEVNTKSGTFDYSNKIGTVNNGSKIGTIIGEKYDNHSPNHRWFKVKLAEKSQDCSGWTGGIFGCDDVTTAWVRADTVTFNSQNKTPYACQIERICKGGTDKTDGAISSMIYNIYKGMSSEAQRNACQKVGVISSGADGDMIEKYSTNLLGAEVFPHSNWINPIIQHKEPYSGADGEAFECGDMLNDL